jgi:Zn-dependent protease
MSPDFVIHIFQFFVLLFALSLKEAAHGWMAWRLGDPTARMLGRVTLNPVKHIDPLGTIIMPLLQIIGPMIGLGLFGGSGFFLFGWAKPTPITTRNFKRPVRDDVLSTLAGPLSNILFAVISLILLICIAKFAPLGAANVKMMAMGVQMPELIERSNIVYPLVVIFYSAITINLFIAIFNLLPLPPLDGARILRHFLPYKALQVYDRLGMISLLLIFFLGFPLIRLPLALALQIFNGIIMNV